MKTGDLILISVLLIALVAGYFLFFNDKSKAGNSKTGDSQKINPKYQAYIDHTKAWLKNSPADQKVIKEGATTRGITYAESLQMAAEWYAEQDGIQKYI